MHRNFCMRIVGVVLITSGLARAGDSAFENRFESITDIEVEAGFSQSFTGDFQVFAGRIELAAGDQVVFETVRKGTTSGLDTVLYLYRKGGETPFTGENLIAIDDDSGFGRLSRISQQINQSGSYLVAIGTYLGVGRGTFNLRVTCDNGPCTKASEPTAPADCQPEIARAIVACQNDWLADQDYDSTAATPLEVLQSCADAEVVAPAFDALCSATPPPLMCAAGFEHFATHDLVRCGHALIDQALDGSCVFGQRYGDAFWRPASVAVVPGQRRVLTSADVLTELESQQVVEAVKTSAHGDVGDATAAFAVVDEGKINQISLWDTSARRAITLYEFGAGDNSFGAYFRRDTLEVVAQINDGDITACHLTFGREHRPCSATVPCRDGLTCVGGDAGYGPGRCIDLQADPPAGQDCALDDDCLPQAGVCAEAGPGFGLCVPAWMRGRFVGVEQQVPIDANHGAHIQIPVMGLGTVATDVSIDLGLSHPRPEALRITLENPATSEVLVLQNAAPGQEIVLSGVPLHGFSGDESANGTWVLHVVQTGPGNPGVVHHVALTVTSRWD